MGEVRAVPAPDEGPRSADVSWPGAPPGAAGTAGPSAEPSLEPSDAEWVSRALTGSRAARGALYDRHAARLLVRATRWLGRTHEAEDLLHDAFVSAFEQLPHLREPERFAAWLERIAVRLAHRRFRRRNLLRRLGFGAGSGDAELEQLGEECDVEARVQLARCARELAALPASERMAWTLRVLEGHSLAEVAELCECSLATAKRRVTAAQRRVGRHVRLAEPSEEP